MVFHSFVYHRQLFFHSELDKPHYWPLACFFTFNEWCERCNTFSQLLLQMETASGYFSPFPHEWACQFTLASGLWGFIWMTPMIMKCILFCVKFDFRIPVSLVFILDELFFFTVLSLLCILQVAFGLQTTPCICVSQLIMWWQQIKIESVAITLSFMLVQSL